MNYTPAFCENGCYHIFNRANGNELLFRDEQNYQFFIRKIKEYLLPVADFYAYCLLPNHYHFVLQLKPASSIKKLLKKKAIEQEAKDWYNEFISKTFRSFQISYAKSYNSYYFRMGSLFISPLKRIIIDNKAQFASTIFYVHKNPVHHGLCKEMKDWKFSSYRCFFTDTYTLIKKEYVIDFFDGLPGFQKFHQQPICLKTAKVIE